MKHFIHIICALILIPLCAFAQLSTCDVSGTAYGLNGQPASGIKIRITKVEQSGTLIRTGILETTTAVGGTWTLTIPRSSTAYFCAVGADLVNMPACTNTTRKTIPNSATADFSSLSPATVTAQNSIAITVKDEGIALPTTASTINFVGSGVSATQPSSGVATVTISGGGGGGGDLTVQEADTSPSISTVDTIRVDQADGFVLTNPAAGIARIDLAAVPYSALTLTGSIVNADVSASAAIAFSKLAALTVSRALASNSSGVIVASSVTDTELGYVSGVTSAIQTQIDARALAARTISAGAGLSGGGDLSADRTLSLDLSTLVGNQTIWDSSQASRTLTAGLSGVTDPVITFSNSSVDITTGTLKQGGTAVSLSGHAHAASDITSGQLALAQGGTGVDLSATGAGYLKQATTGANVTVGAIAAGDLPTAIDAAKIADGSVSNAEFQRLDGVTSAIQTQIDGKQATLTNSAGLAGALNDETGSGLAVFATSPTITTPSIAKLANLTSNGFVKTSGGDGTLSVDTATYITASSSDTLTNKTLDVEGTGNLVTIPFKIYFPAAGCDNATAGPMWNLPTSLAPTSTCVTGTNRQKGVFSFPDSDGDYSAQVETMLPADWAGAIDAKIRWYSTTATTGDVVWQVQTSCVADAETDDPAWNTASTVTDTAKGTTSQMNDATITGVTATGCAAGEMLNLRILRNRTHASDSITGAILFVGLEVTIRRGM